MDQLCDCFLGIVFQYLQNFNFINNQQGLWQGYPLSPMLFIIVMDTLDLLITKAFEAGVGDDLGANHFEVYQRRCSMRQRGRSATCDRS
jgi:hypothetical protein